jgi:hypothetical protein
MNNEITPDWIRRFHLYFGDYSHRIFKDNLPLTKLIELQNAVESFIESELETAKQEERERLIGILEGMRTNHHNCGCCSP